MKEPNNTPPAMLKTAPKSIKPIPLGDLPFSFLYSLKYIEANISTRIDIIPIIIFKLIETKLLTILNKTKIAVYALIGFLVAVASIIQVSRIGSMDYANGGSGYEMDAIAAVIVGGTRMSGGRGSIQGTVLGMIIIAVMNNLLNLLGVPPFLREAFKGAIVIFAVLLQRKEQTS